MEGHCWTGQSPQWAVVPVEEEEDIKLILVDCHSSQNTGLSQNFSICKLNQWLAYKCKFCNELSTCNTV